MVVIVLMLASFALTSAMVVAVIVTAQRERARSRGAIRNAKKLAPSISFVTLFPGDARFDPSVKDSYIEVLRCVLVSDYLDSSDIRQAVDQVLPPARPASPNRPRFPNG